jgi:pimeloyl-ACP methyl ester carboxylesterase
MAAIPLVLLPGTLCDARVWRAQVDVLSAQRPVVVCQLGGERTMESEVTSYLDIFPPRFVLGGFSLGGIVALEFYRQAPDRVAGLILVSSNARPDPEPSRENRRKLVAQVEAGELEHVFDESLLPWYFWHQCGNRDELTRLVRAMAHSNVASFANQSRYASDRPDSRPLLKSINVPVLLICGDSDVLTPPERQEELAYGLSQATSMLIPQCGHFATLEAPDACSQAMKRWLLEMIPEPV